jgi:hypothetical protein
LALSSDAYSHYFRVYLGGVSDGVVLPQDREGVIINTHRPQFLPS